MNCTGFHAWLNAGRPAAQAMGAAAHASGCAVCVRADALDRYLDGLLAAGPPKAPAGLTLRIQTSIQQTARHGRPRAFGWWEVLADPAAAFAIVCGAVALALGSLWSVPGLALAAQQTLAPLRQAVAAAGRTAPVPESAAAQLALAVASIVAMLAATWLITIGVDGTLPRGLAEGRHPVPTSARGS